MLSNILFILELMGHDEYSQEHKHLVELNNLFDRHFEGPAYFKSSLDSTGLQILTALNSLSFFKPDADKGREEELHAEMQLFQLSMHIIHSLLKSKAQKSSALDLALSRLDSTLLFENDDTLFNRIINTSEAMRAFNPSNIDIFGMKWLLPRILALDSSSSKKVAQLQNVYANTVDAIKLGFSNECDIIAIAKHRTEGIDGGTWFELTVSDETIALLESGSEDGENIWNLILKNGFTTPFQGRHFVSAWVKSSASASSLMRLRTSFSTDLQPYDQLGLDRAVKSKSLEENPDLADILNQLPNDWSKKIIDAI